MSFASIKTSRRVFSERNGTPAIRRKKVLADGRLEFSFVVNGLDGMLQWIYQWIPHVEVVAPEELRARLLGDAVRVLERHEPGNQGGTSVKGRKR